MSKTSTLTFLDLYSQSVEDSSDLRERAAQGLLIAPFRGLLPIILSVITTHFHEIWNFAKFDLR